MYASREESYDREPIDDSNPRCVRILRSRNSERLRSDPRSQSTLLFLGPRTMPCRDSGLLHDTRNIMGTSGNVFERPPVQEGLSSTIFTNSKNLASSSQELRLDTVETARKNSEMKRESLNTTIPSPHFQSRNGLLKHIGGTYSHTGTMEHSLGTPGRSIPCTLATPSERASERADRGVTSALACPTHRKIHKVHRRARSLPASRASEGASDRRGVWIILRRTGGDHRWLTLIGKPFARRSTKVLKAAIGENCTSTTNK